MSFRKFLTTIVFVCPLVSQAVGPRDGGGATAAVCFKDGVAAKVLNYNENDKRKGQPMDIPNKHIGDIISVIPLDWKEAIGLTDKLLTMKENESEFQFLDRVLERFKVVTPKLYEGLIQAKKSLTLDKVSQDEDGISPMPDVAAIPRIDFEKCVYATIAYQEGAAANLNRVHIDKRIFALPYTKFSKFHRAVTYLHEVVYKYLRMIANVENGNAARGFVGLFLREQITLREIYDQFNLANIKYNHILADVEAAGVIGLTGNTGNYQLGPKGAGLTVLFNEYLSDVKERALKFEPNRVKEQVFAIINQRLMGRSLRKMSSEQKEDLMRQVSRQMTNELTPQISSNLQLHFIQNLEPQLGPSWQTRFMNFPLLSQQGKNTLAGIMATIIHEPKLSLKMTCGNFLIFADNKLRNSDLVTTRYLAEGAYEECEYEVGVFTPNLSKELDNLYNEMVETPF